MREIDILTLESPETETKIKTDDFVISTSKKPLIDKRVFEKPQMMKTNSFSTPKIDNDLLDKYEIVKTAVKKEPKEKTMSYDFNPSIETVTYSQKQVKQKSTIKLTGRGIISSICYTAVGLFLGFAIIYNSFVLSNVATQISTISTAIESFQVGELTRLSSEVEDIKQEVENIETARENGYIDENHSQTQQISPIEKKPITKITPKTNIFDRIVNAIAQFFGGG